MQVGGYTGAFEHLGSPHAGPTHAMKAIVAILCLLLANPSFAGTWGLGQFENDQALDLSSNWAESGSVADIRKALDAVHKATYVDASEAVTALVAAEVVAASLGKPGKDLPEDLGSWIERQPASELQALEPLARAAISRITSSGNSELYELWEEEDVAEWLATVAELDARLAQP